MQVLSSLRSAKNRHKDCIVVRRRGRVYVICKSNPRFKRRARREKEKRLIFLAPIPIQSVL